MAQSWTLLSILFCVIVAQEVPSRQYTDYTLLGMVTTLAVDNGFRLGPAIFFSNPDAGEVGVGSITLVEESTVTRGSTKASSYPFTATQKFIKGWAWGGNSTRLALMVINDRGKGYLGKYNFTFANFTESDTFENCTEDDPPICYGNVTVVTRKIATTGTRVGNLAVGMDPVLQGHVDWTSKRGYFLGVENNFTVYVWSLEPTFELISQIRVTAANGTGFVQQSQLSEDGSILYILTDSGLFYKITGINGTRSQVELILKFSIYTPISFIVSDRWEEALFTSAGSPTKLLWVDLEQKRVYETQSFTSIFSPQVVLKDPEAGFAFVVGFNSPSKVIRVNLETHDYDDPFSLQDAGRSTNGFLDTTTAKMWIASSRQVVAAIYPGACSNNCSGKGDCTFGGVCKCYPGYDGEACELMGCPVGFDNQICSGNGLCNNGSCACFPGYAGDDCDTYTCNADCSGHGYCDKDNHICACDAGWTGNDCSQSLLAICSGATSCYLCGKRTECVWCESNSSCILGDINGPLLDYCPQWHYRSCNWIGFRVIGYLFLAVIFFFLFLNFVFRVREDSYGGAVLANRANIVRSLWISQRSLQTWIMIEQIQFAALVGYLLPPIPSNLKSFTDAISVFLISSAPAWQSPHLPQVPSRTIQNFLQIGVTKGTNPMDLMAGTFFIFLLILGGVMIFGLIALISKNEMARWRTTHIFLRVLQFSQIGLCALGAWTVTQIGKDWGDAQAPGFSIAAAFISIIFFGLLYPVGVWLFVFFNKKHLFSPQYRVQFGSLYDHFHHDKLWFGSFVLFKNGAIALFIGFFADSSTGFHAEVMSMVMPMIIIALSVIVTVVARPFVDKIRGLIQVFMLGCFDIIMFGLCIVYLNFEPYDGWAVAVCAIAGGALFFTCLMWVMNHMRIGPVNKNIGAEDGAASYVRM